MRSHAKASTAGSTQRQAKSLGVTLRTGALSLALLVAILCLALGAASAVAVAPTISSTSVSAVTSKTAVLEASVNPEGEATTFEFQYGLADCSASPCSATGANVGSGAAAVKVSRQIEGLSPDTTYHYRVLATNGSGVVEGPDRTFTTFAPPPSIACPNEAFRFGPSGNLPDCRAYEMVSPVDKNGGEIKTLCNINCNRATFIQSTLDGDKITYSSSFSFGDAVAGPYSNQYIASRGAAGWSSHGISPPRRTGLFPSLNAYADLEVMFKDFSDDLSTAWLYDSSLEPLTPDALEASTNLFRRDNMTDSYEALTINELVVPPALGDEFEVPQMQGHSKDGEHALFIAAEPLTPNAASSSAYQLYDFSGGKLHLVSVLPDGTAASEQSWAGTLNFGTYGATHGVHTLDNAISEDGSRVFWSSTSSGSGPGAIYVRENPAEAQSALNGSNECTEPAKACTRSITGRGQFWTAATDGSKVLISTDDASTPGVDIEALSTFDVDAETTTPIAAALIGVLGASDDLSRIYFVSEEALAGGATAGEPNLYLDEEGAKTFIATLSTRDTSQNNPYSVGSAKPLNNSSRVTADGAHIAFPSIRSLTGYDNTDAVNGEPDLEVYVYDADTQQLTCASCNPSGARPAGKPLQEPYTVGDKPLIGLEARTAAAWLPTAENSLHTPRALSEDGNRLFFNSFDTLLPQDTNGVQDVYQWEAEGTGTCEKAGGCVSLISTGQSPKKSEFVDATPDGSSVFIETSSSIDPRDPGLIDIYVARENGGYPPPPAPPTPCVGDACQSIPAAPNDPTPASAGFRGAGSPVTAKTQRRKCRARGRRGAKRSLKTKRSKKARNCRRAKRGAGR